MSIDIRKENLCDHVVREEAKIFESDLRTIKIRRPIANTSQFKLNLNGYNVPQNHPDLGYYFATDESTFLDIELKNIKFNNRRQNDDDFVDITYSTIPRFCPKCFGLRVVIDIKFNNLGKAVVVRDENKLIQDIETMVTTVLGSNPFHTSLGTNLKNLIGQKVFDLRNIRAQMSKEIVDGINKYVNMQDKQIEFQTVTAKETFFKLLNIEAEPTRNDIPSLWNVNITFQNLAGSTLVDEVDVGPLTLDEIIFGKQG